MPSGVIERDTGRLRARRSRLPRKVRRALGESRRTPRPVSGVDIAWGRPPGHAGVDVQALAPLVATYTTLYGSSWRPLTRTKHAADFRRFLDWLRATGRPATTAALDFATLVAYVADLRTRPKVTGVWRGAPDARARSSARGISTLSANSVNAYMRPIRSLCLWLVEEGILAANPFSRSHARAGHNPLLPKEETPPRSATLADLQAIERGCAGEGPLDLRDQAILSLLKTTAARNASVRLLRVEDLDVERAIIRFRRAKGDKTLEVALHPETRVAVLTYLERARPALLAGAVDDPAYLFLSARHERGPRPLTVNAVSLMLRRRYHAGGGTLPTFGSHRIRHATATLLVNHGMPLEEVSRYLGHSSTDVTRRYAQQTPDALGARAAEALARAGLVGG